MKKATSQNGTPHRKRLPPWPPRQFALPSLAQLERLSLETDPPAEPKELPAYRPYGWEVDANDPPPYPACDDITAARCLWSPKASLVRTGHEQIDSSSGNEPTTLASAAK